MLYGTEESGSLVYLASEVAGMCLTYGRDSREVRCECGYHHEFEAVLASVLSGPQGFYVPQQAMEDYSAQELRLIERFRAWLLSDRKA